MKEVGKIENDKATFMQITFDVDIHTGDVDTDVNYDKRVLSVKKEGKLKELISEFTNKLYECREE